VHGVADPQGAGGLQYPFGQQGDRATSMSISVGIFLICLSLFHFFLSKYVL
jgi:hypothetical protein